MNKNEKIADIVASLRDGSIYDENGCFDSKEIADRIEAALKRERHFADVGKMGGNAAAMRDALESCLDFIMRLDRVFNLFMLNLLNGAISKAKAALAKPPRIVDAYTDWHDALKAAIAKCKSWKPTACLECPFFIPHTTGACLMRRLYSEVKNESEVNNGSR